MRFAAIADIHGNAFALDAVLRDMEAHGVETAVNLGDLLSGPIAPAETAALLRERDFVTIRGNHDRYLIDMDPTEMGPSDRVAHDRLSREDLDWLAKAPPTQSAFGDVFLCHGTPKDDNRYWLERVEPNGVVRAATLAETQAEAEGVEARLILCAHSHLPRCVRLPDGRVIANPGSV
ncbi:MAG: metallophosphoesterase family protein, partial [Pseudomonadota bacterium]